MPEVESDLKKNDAIKTIPPKIYKYFVANGPDNEKFGLIKDKIKQRFRGSENKTSYGQDIISAIEEQYRIALKKFEAKEKSRQQRLYEEQQRKEREKRRENSPERKDQRCIEVLKNLDEKQHVTMNDMNYFRETMEKYHGKFPAKYEHMIHLAQAAFSDRSFRLIDDDDAHPDYLKWRCERDKIVQKGGIPKPYNGPVFLPSVNENLDSFKVEGQCDLESH